MKNTITQLARWKIERELKNARRWHQLATAAENRVPHLLGVETDDEFNRVVDQVIEVTANGKRSVARFLNALGVITLRARATKRGGKR